MPLLVTCGINPPFGGLSPISGQVAHVLLTLAPLTTRCIATPDDPFDLHVLSTPPAFVLSQNQTLHKENLCNGLLGPLLAAGLILPLSDRLWFSDRMP